MKTIATLALIACAFAFSACSSDEPAQHSYHTGTQTTTTTGYSKY